MIMKAGGVFFIVSGLAMLMDRVVFVVAYLLDPDQSVGSGALESILNLLWLLAPAIQVAAGLYLFLGGRRIIEMLFATPQAAGDSPDVLASREITP
ncbi:MAG: hypothetical protein H6812_12975 [Phycisphaeraceae bacterium]|nr:hypothetical protein [Phycisphaeraceae bacterium]